VRRVFSRRSGDRSGIILRRDHSRAGRVFYVTERTFQGNHAPERSRLPKKVIALCLAVVFIGGVLFTAWPRLYLPSVDFIFESIGLTRDSRVHSTRPAVVRLTVIARDQGSSGMLAQRHGTGFNIDPNGIIVTNRHVVQDAVRIAVSFPEDGVYNVRECVFRKDCDLAVLVLEKRPGDLPVAEIAHSARVRSGEEVLVIGNPLGVERVVVRGTIAGILRPPQCQVPVLELRAPIHPGHSGSPVVDKNGRVVGVVFGSLRSGTEIRGLAVPAAYIKDCLGKLRTAPGD